MFGSGCAESELIKEVNGLNKEREELIKTIESQQDTINELKNKIEQQEITIDKMKRCVNCKNDICEDCVKYDKWVFDDGQ